METWKPNDELNLDFKAECSQILWFRTMKFNCIWPILWFLFQGNLTVGQEHKTADLLDLSLEELTQIKFSSSSFFDQDIRLAPGYNLVIDMEKGEQSASRTLGEMLSSRAPGINVSRHERQGVLLGTRRLMIDNNAKTNVMLDGQTINQRVHFGSMISIDSPLIGDLQRVELSLSPGTILHGSGAVNGFLNLIPKNGTDNKGTFVNFEHEFKEDLYALELGHGFAYGENRDLYMYFGAVSPSGFTPDEFYVNVDPVRFDMKRSEVKGFEDWGYRISSFWNHDNANLNVFYEHLTPLLGGLDDSESWLQTTLAIRPKYTWTLGPDSSLETKLAAELFDYGPQINGDFSSNFPRKNDLGGSESHWQSTFIFRTEKFEKHKIALGGEYGERRFNNQERFFRSTSEGGFESVDFDWKTASTYVEDLYSLTDQLTLTYGIRYDHVDYGLFCGDESETCLLRNENLSSEDHWSPRVAISYALNPETIIKFSYQHGFRYPDAVYYQWKPFWDNIVPGAGLDIESESLDSLEINLSSQLTDTVAIDGNLYYNQRKDTLSFVFF